AWRQASAGQQQGGGEVSSRLHHASSEPVQDSGSNPSAAAYHRGMTIHDEDPRVAQIARLLDSDGKAPSLDELGAATGLSPFQVQRLFTRATGMSPAAFARALREERAVRALESGGRITDAIYDAGYESAGRFYAAMRERLGMTPSAWRKGGAGVRIGYIVEPTSLGPMLLAATDKGVCRLSFHEGADDLAARFPAAELVEGAVPAELVALVVRAIEAPV